MARLTSVNDCGWGLRVFRRRLNGATTMKPAALLAALLPIAASADITPSPPEKAQACALVNSINSWTESDASTVVLETSPKHRYKVTFTAPCADAKRAIMVLIDRPPSAGACLSPGDALLFLRRASVPPQSFHYDERCVIKTIEPLAAE